MKEETCEASAPTDNILYVVFHGELAFYDNWDSEYIRVFAPVVDTHIYMAGPWLAEHHIPRGTTMKLLNVQSGEGSLSDSKIIRLGQGCEPRPASAHFEIRFPRPHRILPGFVIKVPQGAIKITPPQNPACESGSTIPLDFDTMDLRPVFEYKMTSGIAYLSDLDNDSDDLPSCPNWGSGAGLNRFHSLHVFAEEDSFLTDDDEHAAVAFGKCGQVLGVNGLTVHDRPSESSKGCCIPGLHPSEHNFTLPERSKALADLGVQLRQGKDSHLQWHEHASSTSAKPDRAHAQGQASCGPVGN